MIQISNGAGRLVTVDRTTDGRVILELEDTGEYVPEPPGFPPAADRPVAISANLEHSLAALVAVAILNANLGGDAWANLQKAYPRVIVPEDFDTGSALPRRP